MEKVTITISGKASTGKTTLALVLAQHLSVTYGIVAPVTDPDVTPALISRLAGGELSKNLSKLGEKYDYEIVTAQTKRDIKAGTDYITMTKANHAAVHNSLKEVKAFLDHIEPRVGWQAFAHIEKIVNGAITKLKV